MNTCCERQTARFNSRINSFGSHQHGVAKPAGLHITCAFGYILYPCNAFSQPFGKDIRFVTGILYRIRESLFPD